MFHCLSFQQRWGSLCSPLFARALTCNPDKFRVSYQFGTCTPGESCVAVDCRQYLLAFGPVEFGDTSWPLHPLKPMQGPAALRNCLVLDPAGLPSFSSAGECCNGTGSTQSARDPCSKPHTPPDSPATQCSPVPFARCRRQSHADSFDDACEESASAVRCSKELMRGSLRVNSETQCKSSLSECGEVPGVGRELSREASEPFAYHSPPVSTGSVPCMRKVASKDSADKLQSALTWRTCKGSDPACQEDKLSSSTAQKAEEHLLESAMQPSLPSLRLPAYHRPCGSTDSSGLWGDAQLLERGP